MYGWIGGIDIGSKKWNKRSNPTRPVSAHLPVAALAGHPMIPSPSHPFRLFSLSAAGMFLGRFRLTTTTPLQDPRGVGSTPRLFLSLSEFLSFFRPQSLPCGGPVALSPHGACCAANGPNLNSTTKKTAIWASPVRARTAVAQRAHDFPWAPSESLTSSRRHSFRASCLTHYSAVSAVYRYLGLACCDPDIPTSANANQGSSTRVSLVGP